MGRKAGKMCKSRLFPSISSLPSQTDVVFLPSLLRFQTDFATHHLVFTLAVVTAQAVNRLFKLRDREALAGQPAAEWPLASHQAKGARRVRGVS